MDRELVQRVVAAAVIWLCLAVWPTRGEDLSSSVSLHIEDDGVVVVSGLPTPWLDIEPDAWKQVLRVVARDPQRPLGSSELPALLGHYAMDAGTLRFTPRYAPLPGLVIEAIFDPRAGQRSTAGRVPEPRLTAEHRIPEPADRVVTSVSGIQPRTSTVPSNLLRWYIQFSAPMSVRQVLPYVQLLDDAGAVVETAFVEVEGGLWDPTRTRLTLFVHPGRVKRGVGPNQALGPVLEAGRSYRLRVDAQARDGQGQPLASTFEHRFTVGPEDHDPPDPTRWTLASPRPGASPLRITLAASADHALLERLLTVVDADQRVVDGRFVVGPSGREVVFTPVEAWRLGSYSLVVPTWLEDLAGNRIDRHFEVSGGDGGDSRSADPVRIGFRVE
ncbi:MAG: hypothetical protein AAGE94_08150 [Acidobacteriota bacterium]